MNKAPVRLFAGLVAVLLYAAAPIVHGQGRIVSEEQEAVFRKAIPDLADAEDQRILREDPTTMFYTIHEMPRAFQFDPRNGFAQSTAFFWSGYNFSGDNDPVFHSALKPHGMDGNGNVDFPWRADVPGGTHRCDTVTSFKALWLPKRSDGSPYEVALFRQVIRNSINGTGRENAHGWIFPVGARLYEVLLMKSPFGTDVTFEIRKRQRELAAWQVEVYRPFPTARSLAERIKEVAPDWEASDKLSTLVSHLENPTTLRRAQLVDTHNRNRRAFNVVAGVDAIPPIGNDELVMNLLTTTRFDYSGGETWKAAAGNSPPAFAASFEGESWHVVPSKYDATFLGSDQKSCLRCHESSNQDVRLFDRNRGWYGNIGGSDGILSWHPIALEAISETGPAGAKPVRFRQEFVDAKVIAPFNPQRHSPAMYRRIPGLQ